MLFDLPERPPARARALPGGVVSEPEKTPRTPLLYREKPRLGTIDGQHQCFDDSCGAMCNDIVAEDRGQWLLECAFCGTRQWAPVVPGHLRQDGEFRLRDGRFAGLTFDEVAMRPRGLDYISDVAREHKREAVKRAASEWLATHQPNRYATASDNQDGA